MAVSPSVRIKVSGARGVRGAASGPLGVGSVDSETISNDGSEQDAIRDKIDAPSKDDLEKINQNESGGFWNGWNTTDFPAPSNLDGKGQRLNDRLFVGAATDTSGDFPATNKDYYEQYESDHTSNYGFRTSWSTGAFGSTVGGIGVLGFARTSDTAVDIPFQLGVGGWFASINDNTANPCLATGLYGVAFREVGAGQGVAGVGTVGGEVDICNLGNSVKVSPGNLYPSTGFTTAWQVNSGAFVTGAHTASAGITIGNNKADFFSGIVIAQNAIAGVNLDGSGKAISGAGTAIAMGAFQQTEWWVYPFTTPSFLIASYQLTERTAPMVIGAYDDGIHFGGANSNGLALKVVYPGGETGSYLSIIPAYSANPLTLAAMGQANADILLQPNGTGRFRLPIANVPTAANDTAAATVGVPVGGFYRNGSVAMIRVT